MNTADRLTWLEDKHKHVHNLIEAAEAEKAPEDYVSRLKKDKLLLKDEMHVLRSKIVDIYN
jgi:uncharacterized protein YdcH (DUF465 family)|tara:strand:+ start:131 stop:313 length:183 start_codon:yes stop_codon:yes gene_type:complete